MSFTFCVFARSKNSFLFRKFIAWRMRDHAPLPSLDPNVDCHISRPSGPIQGLSWLNIVTTTPAVAHTHSSGAPEIFEAFLTQFRVAGGVPDGAMPEPILNRPRIVARVGQRIAAGVP